VATKAEAHRLIDKLRKRHKPSATAAK